MNPILLAGTRIVVLALLAYSAAIITEQRKRMASNFVIVFLTLGIALDITATAFMIAGSSNSPFTLHGFLGYSALLAMLVDFVLILRFRFFHSRRDELGSGLHFYSRYAYLWWIVAFVTGSLMVMLK